MVADSTFSAGSSRLMDLVMRLDRCCHARELQIREAAGLTEAEYACLNAVRPDERLSVGTLSDRMGLSKSRGGRVVERLVQRKLLDRHSQDEDRRIAEVTLTAAGRTIQRQINECMEACEAALRRRLSRPQQRTAQTGLMLMINALEKS